MQALARRRLTGLEALERDGHGVEDRGERREAEADDERAHGREYRVPARGRRGASAAQAYRV